MHVAFYNVILTRNPSFRRAQLFRCMDDGIYKFILNATEDKTKARYSTVYIKGGNGAWKIAHHH